MPTVILARTLKGKGVSSVEDVDGVHGKAISNADEAIEELGGLRSIIVNVSVPENGTTPNVFPVGHRSRPVYEVGDEVATRKAYGDALVALGYERNDVVAVDGEVSNSTYTEFFAEAHPDRYIEMYIAEQQMVATAVGLQVRNWICFASTFAAFLSRAYDFIRMAAISQANLRLIGSHAGVSIGEDGPSQMGLEDIATMRAIHGSVVLYPADANQAAKLVPMMADQSGIVYMRTTREPLPVIYGADQEFTIGGSHIVRSSDNDDVTIVAAGITVHEALKAADALSECGVNACVIDMYSVKPIDAETLKMAVADTGLLVTVEDHWCEGGLGEAVLHVFAYAKERPPIKVLAVRDMPKSGPAADLLKAAGIDADHIVVAVRNLLAEHGSSLPR